MVAHRTLTPFVRVRILHPLPKQFIGFDELLFLLAAWHQNPNKTNQISARSAEGASRVRILHPLPKATHHCRWVAFLLAAWHQNKIKLSSPSDELSFTVGTFRTENIRRQLPRRAFETIRDYPRICAMPTSSGADETYPTLRLPHKRPEPAQEPTERALGQYLVSVPQCPSPGLR